MQMFRRLMTMLVVATSLTGAAVAQVTPDTAAAAKELTASLEGQAEGVAPRFIAANDPSDPERFVAAMLLPGIQLVIVSAEYPAPVLLRERLLTGKFQDAYQDLSAASVPESRLMIEDVRADGLAFRPGKGQAADVVIHGTDEPYRFDWQWRRNRIRQDDYMAKFEETRAEYLRLVGLLTEAAKRQP
jgi:hypothetical protein